MTILALLVRGTSEVDEKRALGWSEDPGPPKVRDFLGKIPKNRLSPHRLIGLGQHPFKVQIRDRSPVG